MPDVFISEPCSGFIYVAETARAGSRKLRWSRMPAHVPEPDELVDPRRVPLDVRRDGRRCLLGNDP